MAEIRVRKSIGPSGKATLKGLKDGTYRIAFEDGSIYDTASNRPYDNGTYNVTLSMDKTRIVGVKPLAGQAVLQFKQWGNRINGGVPGQPGLPASKVIPARIVTRKDGQRYPQKEQLVAIAEFDVMQGEFEGLTVTTMIPYSFSASTTGSNLTEYQDSNRNLQNLETFFRCTTGHALGDVDVEYSDDSTTLLLRYEKFVLANNRPFLSNINDSGFAELKTFSALPADLMPKPKKAKARTAKKKK